MAQVSLQSLRTSFLPPTQTRKVQNPPFHFRSRSINLSNHRLLLLSSWTPHIRRSFKWDSNAESYNNFSSEETQEFDENVALWFDVLQDYVDSIWILKVFGSYGWALPFIISSLLLTNGPKAFLVALALPIGQSTLTFALQRFLNGGKMKPKLKNKAKRRRSRGYNSRKAKLEETTEWIGGSKGARKKKKIYHQSPIYEDNVSVSNRGDGRVSEYGGWDELLDAEVESSVGSSEWVAQESNKLRGGPEKMGKSRRLSENDGPPLLRLLISVFPFWSSD